MARKPSGNSFPLNDQSGQLSIFLGITVIVIITLLAFVINIGLFVKARINLQNAVDAGAWSGAAVQSRQLTNLAYLNWEMRNTYKEWMFKYYVLGNAANSQIGKNIGGIANFRIKDFNSSLSSPTFNNDTFNLPSVCIHFDAQTNICDLSDTPGLPRFGSVGTPDISQAFEETIDAFSEIKAKNCLIRTRVNLAAALTWALGIGKGSAGDRLPAASRVGAWPEAAQLAFRMRNLEMLVNRPPVNEICLNNCSGRVDQLISDQSGTVPANERPIKAFLATMRNLSGGTFKENNSPEGSGGMTDEMTSNLILREISPNDSLKVDGTGLSNLLIPPGKSFPGGQPYSVKYYLDLIPMTLNLVTFYNNFVSKSEAAGTNTSAPGTAADAACLVSKTALPIPGYLFGFYKNPEILTYYALEAKTRFLGMFNPFSEPEGIEISAYAVAKPFGGRIGPMLVNQGENRSTMRIRKNPDRSFGHFATLDIIGNSGYVAGKPTPFSNDFYLSNLDDPIGGTLDGAAANEKMKFAVPNLIYDYNSAIESYAATGGLLKFQDLATGSSPQKGGLLDADQFKMLLDKTGASAALSGSGSINGTQVSEMIEKVRAPTAYEVANYLIPYIGDSAGLDAGFFLNSSPQGNNSFLYEIYAPLFGQNTLYDNINDFNSTISNYMQQLGIAAERSYFPALAKVAQAIANDSGTGNVNLFDSAKVVFPATNKNDYQGYVSNPQSGIDRVVAEIGSGAGCNPENLSIAARYKILMNPPGPQAEICQITPLRELVTTYIREQSQINSNFQQFYSQTYRLNGLTREKIMSAYRPGTRQGALDTGAGRDGTSVNVNKGGASLLHIRNSYSTKLMPLSHVLSGSNLSYDRIPSGSNAVYLEGPFNGSDLPSKIELKYGPPINLISEQVLNANLIPKKFNTSY